MEYKIAFWIVLIIGVVLGIVLYLNVEDAKTNEKELKVCQEELNKTTINMNFYHDYWEGEYSGKPSAYMQAWHDCWQSCIYDIREQWIRDYYASLVQ